jgi:hypothetical protein
MSYFSKNDITFQQAQPTNIQEQRAAFLRSVYMWLMGGFCVAAVGAYVSCFKGDKMEIPVTKITLTKWEHPDASPEFKSENIELLLNPGEDSELIIDIQPSNATNKTIIWKTSDPKIATVKNGTVTAHNFGKATITATSSNGVTASYPVAIYDIL